MNYHAQAVCIKNNVNVLYIMPDDQINGYEIDHFIDGDITTTIVYFKRGLIKYINYWLAFIKGYNFLINKKKCKFDLVHMNIMHPAIWQALYLKWKYKLPYIVSENWHGFQDLSIYKIGIFSRLLIKKGFNNSFAICPVSQQLKNSMINSGFKANYKLIPNVVNTQFFK